MSWELIWHSDGVSGYYDELFKQSPVYQSRRLTSQHPAGIILKNKLTNAYMLIVIVTAINEFNNHANGKHSCYCVKKTNRFAIKTSD